MTRPTPRAVLLFAATQSAALLALLANRALWPLVVAFGVVVFALMLADAMLALARRRLVVTTEAPARLYVGARGELVVLIAQSGRPTPARFDLLCEYSGEAPTPEPLTLETDAAGAAVARVAIEPPRRGVMTLEAVWLRWRGPLGLIARVARFPVGRSIDITPDARGARAAALAFSARDSLYGLKAQLQKGEGAEFDSLREHAAGLDARFIDWKRSAKHRKLLSKEFRIEQNHHVVIAFDSGHLMIEEMDGVARLDHAIAAGLALGYSALRGGDLVGLYAFDAAPRKYVPPERGAAHFQRLQRAAATLAYSPIETNYTLGLVELNMRLKRRALVVLFTDFVDSTSAELLVESLEAMANRHAIVFVVLRDPQLETLAATPPDSFDAAAQAVIAQDFEREKAIVLERLARIGAHCLETTAKGLSPQLINLYLTLKQRGTI